MELDHIAVSGKSLAEATAHVEDSLGVRVQPGGTHDVFSTHNTLLGLEDGLYLEAIAINPEAPTPERPRWFDLDRFDGPARLTNWICRTENLDALLERAPQGSGEPVALSRGDLRWRMAVPRSGILPFDNCAPALLQWQTQVHPWQLLAPSGVRLLRLVITHPEATALRQVLSHDFFDNRVVFDNGPVGLHAEFDTPGGQRVL